MITTKQEKGTQEAKINETEVTGGCIYGENSENIGQIFGA